MIDKIFWSNMVLFVAFTIAANIINLIDEDCKFGENVIYGSWVIISIVSIPLYLLFIIWN